MEIVADIFGAFEPDGFDILLQTEFGGFFADALLADSEYGGGVLIGLHRVKGPERVDHFVSPGYFLHLVRCCSSRTVIFSLDGI